MKAGLLFPVAIEYRYRLSPFAMAQLSWKRIELPQTYRSHMTSPGWSMSRQQRSIA
jgi:hypothetical protein